MEPPTELVIESPEPTDPTGSELSWVRSAVEFDRDRQYWLGASGDEFLLFSWDWPVADLMVQRSVDGLEWSEPTPLIGVPPDASLVEAWRWDRGISVSTAGLIGLFDTTDHADDRQAGHRVFTSADGLVWTEETLPQLEDTTAATGPFGVAASDDGYAVWLTIDERRPRTDILLVRPVDGEWRRVALPVHGTTIENWVAPTNDGFLVRVAELPRAHEGTHPAYHVTVDGTVTSAAVPSDQPPIRWNDSHVAYNPYNTVPRPTLYAGPDADTWYRLPTPDFTTESEEEYWSIDALTAGQPGITVAGCPCGEYWGFLGEGFITIEVDTGDHHVTIQGDLVTVDGIWDHPIRVDTSVWFDDATGTLTVPDPNTGDPIATVTCDQMRASAQAKTYQSELLTPPPQDLLYSPAGTAWTHHYVDDLFGDGSYIDHAATLNDTIALLVDPTGEAPTPDPPGCPLNIYPQTSPYEIWVTTNPGTTPTTVTSTTIATSQTGWNHIHALPDGLSCQALIEGGFSYEEAYVYWLGENDSGYLIDYDAGDEVICQSTYPKDVVTAFWEDSGPVVANQFAFIVSVNPLERTAVVDYATFYDWEESEELCRELGGEYCVEDPPYYIRNENPRLRTLPIAPNAPIAAWTWFGDQPYTCEIAMPWQMNAVGFDAERTGPACFYTLNEYASSDLLSDLVWLTIDNSVITGIQTQYIP